MPNTFSQLGFGHKSVDVSVNKTLTAADSGIVQNVIIDGITITLPATALGIHYTIRNSGATKLLATAGTGDDGSVLVTVAPAAADGITGNGFTATVNKAALNTKATAKVGDYISIMGTGTTGVTGWVMTAVRGTWARQP